MSITNSRAADLLCSAFEGGSNYWYMIEDYVEPAEVAQPWGDEYTPKYISYPFSKGGAVIIADMEDEEEKFTLDHAAIVRGKKIFATDERYSHHYADALKENDDAITGDVFLQLCLFGEVVYG